jgi:hypothetical protein
MKPSNHRCWSTVVGETLVSVDDYAIVMSGAVPSYYMANFLPDI